MPKKVGLMRDLQELLSKKMTRKEFIKLFAAALIAMLGVNNFIANMNKYSKRKAIAKNDSPAKKADSGFGSRKFGV